MGRQVARTTALALLLLVTLQGGPAVAGQQREFHDQGAVFAAFEDSSETPTTGMQFPISPPPQVTRVFARPDRDWSAGHRGVDFSGQPGDPVHAPAAGEVTFVGKVVDREVLVLQHESGLRSSFEPLTSTLSLGQHVNAGAIIGHVADEDDGLGHCGQDCLHWGVRLDDLYLDPLQFVQWAPSVLLPAWS